LVDRLQAFLLELGHGFAFVGRQYHFEVDGDDFLHRRAVLQLGPVPLRRPRAQDRPLPFQPEHTGKPGFYVAWVDEILLCAGRNNNVRPERDWLTAFQGSSVTVQVGPAV